MIFNVTVSSLEEGFLVKPDYPGGGSAWPRAKYVADAYQLGVVVQDMLAAMNAITEKQMARADADMAKYAAQNACNLPIG